MPDELPARSFQPQAEATRPQRDTLAALADELATRPPAPRRSAAADTQSRAELRRPIAPPTPAAAQPAAAEAAATADQNLAEMAQRLEAALRKPNPAADFASAADAGFAKTAARTPATPPRPNEAKPARAEPNQGKTLYDNLEQEMASLLGRSPKT